MRHTTAVHLLEAGVDVNVTRAWLGHVTLETANRYAQITLRTKQAALEKCTARHRGEDSTETTVADRCYPAELAPIAVALTRYIPPERTHNASGHITRTISWLVSNLPFLGRLLAICDVQRPRSVVTLSRQRHSRGSRRGLEDHLQSQLNLPRGSGSIRLSERFVRQPEGSRRRKCVAGGVNHIELNPVEDIIDFGPELHTDPLRDPCILDQSHIRVVIPGTREGVPSQGARSSKRLNRKSAERRAGFGSRRVRWDRRIPDQVRAVG